MHENINLVELITSLPWTVMEVSKFQLPQPFCLLYVWEVLLEQLSCFQASSSVKVLLNRINLGPLELLIL